MFIVPNSTRNRSRIAAGSAIQRYAC
jgi:hypothetical protein